MFAALLSRLPSVRLERELAVLREAHAIAIARLDDAAQREREALAERNLAREQLAACQRKFDRLVEARLAAEGAIATTITHDPAPPAAIPPLFGNIGRLWQQGVDEREATPRPLAGASMAP